MYFSKYIDKSFIKSTRKLWIGGVLDGYVVMIPRITKYHVAPVSVPLLLYFPPPNQRFP